MGYIRILAMPLGIGIQTHTMTEEILKRRERHTHALYSWLPSLTTQGGRACLEHSNDLQVGAAEVLLEHLSIEITIIGNHIPHRRDA